MQFITQVPRQFRYVKAIRSSKSGSPTSIAGPIKDTSFKGLAQNDISNTLVRGMSKEIFSLQSLTEKMRELETGINAKLAEQKPTIDNLTFVWRTITLGVVATVLVALLALAWPSLKTYGGIIADFISSHLQKQ
jgi:dCTP deaminase